jgi:hypothetical protein
MKMTKYSISRRRHGRGRGRGRGRSRGRGRGRNNTAKKSVIKKGGGVRYKQVIDSINYYKIFITKRREGELIRIDIHMIAPAPFVHGTTKLSGKEVLDAKFDFFDEDDQNYIIEIKCDCSNTIDDAAQEELFNVLKKIDIQSIDSDVLINSIKQMDFTNEHDWKDRSAFGV